MQVAAVLIATLLFARLSLGKQLYDLAWVEVRTPHFVVASALDEKTSTELILELERFRRVVASLTNVGRLDEKIPTLIYVFPSMVSEIGLDGDVAGFLATTLRANYAAVRPMPGMPLAQTLQHEYVHFLIRNQNELQYPAWCDEGFAEFLSTTQISGETFQYGAPPSRWQSLGVTTWLPMQTVLTTRDTSELRKEDRYMFYAQSWLLTHYLILGRGNNFAADNARYLKRIEQGVSAKTAFEEVFGVPLEKLRGILQRYLQELHFWKGTLRPQMIETQARHIPRGEIPARIGDLCLALRKGHAEPYLEAALAGDQNNAAALTGLADVYKLAGRFADAEPLYERAIALEPNSALHELDYAEYFYQRATKSADAEERKSWLKRARHHFVRSHQLDDANPETLVMYGSSFLLPGEPPEKGLDTLTLAHQLLPSHPDVKIALARLHIALGRREDARPLLREVLAWGHRDSARVARDLLAQIDTPR